MIDGHDINDMHVNHLRNQVGHNIQEPQLSVANIKANIKMGNPDAMINHTE